MKSWKKPSIIAGILVIVGAGTAFGYEEFYNEKNGYQNYVSNANAIKAAAVSTSASPSQPTSPFSDIDGKVTEVTAEKITVDVPLQGKKTFTIDKNTKIEDFLHPLKKDSLVDLEANGDLAFKIEAEQTIDAYGTIVSVTDKEVTIHYNGAEQSFKKAANFQIDSDGYIGAIEGLPAEISLNENFEVVELEMEDDYDD